MKNIFFLFISLNLFSNIPSNIEIDKSEKRNQINIKTGKVDSYRHYYADTSRVLNMSAESFLNAYMRTNERCDNSLKSERRFTSKSYDCLFQHKDIVEAKKHKIIAPGYGENDYVMTKFMKKQGDQIVQQLVTIKKEFIGGVKHFIIDNKSINDELSKKLTGKDLKFDATVKDARSHFIIKELNPAKIRVTYKYNMSTDHWLINKSILASKVFDGIEESVDKIFEIVQAQSKSNNKN